MAHDSLLLVSSCQNKNQKGLYQLRVCGLKIAQASSYSTSFYDCIRTTVDSTQLATQALPFI